MAPRRSRTLALPCLGAAALACWGLSSAFSAPSFGRLLRTQGATTPAPESRLAQPKTQLAARGGEAVEADSIEVSGFSGLIVGLALLPHVVYTLTIIFDVANGAALTWGPYALNAVSPVISLGVFIWSLGSYIERGRGLPTGPLALMGIAEALSYLALLGAVIAYLIGGTKPGGLQLPTVSLPAAPTISAPSGFKAPELSVPKFQAPEFKAPDVKLPEIKAPDVKLPEVKAPSIKVPEVKLPEKAPAKKEPEKAPAKKEPEKKEAPPAVKAPVKPAEPEKKEAPKAPVKPAVPAGPAPDYDSLFD